MSTGIETWNMNLLDIGPMYPFPGTEMIWVLIGIATWIIWHMIQIKSENASLDREEKDFSDPEKLKNAMNVSNAETLLETIKTHGENYR